MSYHDEQRLIQRQEQFQSKIEQTRQEFQRFAPSWNTGAENKIPDRQEWIIQRCTQKWIGTELQYEDWPAIQRPLSRAEMMDRLEYWNHEYPDDEFRGHNVANCKCDRHFPFKAKSSPSPLPEGDETENTV